MTDKSWMQKLAGFFGAPKSDTSEPAEEVVENPCCNGVVHIAFRGVSDERMYISYSRRWPEVKFFRPRGLRVFCADCRRRLL